MLNKISNHDTLKFIIRSRTYLLLGRPGWLGRPYNQDALKNRDVFNFFYIMQRIIRRYVHNIVIERWYFLKTWNKKIPPQMLHISLNCLPQLYHFNTSNQIHCAQFYILLILIQKNIRLRRNCHKKSVIYTCVYYFFRNTLDFDLFLN